MKNYLRNMQVFVLFAGALLLLFGLVSPANGQEEPAQAVQGTLRVDDSKGEKQPVSGVTVTLAKDDEEIGQANSGDDGKFLIGADEAGTYSVTLDPETLPDDVALRDPEKTTLTVALDADRKRGVIFPLTMGESAVSSFWSGTPGKVARLMVNGIRFGLILAMCSIGLSLIFGTTGLVNFAHGELVTLGAVFALVLDGRVPFLLGAAIAIVLAALAGGLNDRLLWRPLRERGTGLIAMLVISIGLSLLVRNIILWQIGGERQGYSKFSGQTPYEFGPINIAPRQLITIAIAIVSLVIVATIVNKTRIGKAMRAVADNRDLAESSGIDVNKIIQIVWIGGAGLAGLGGVLLGLDQQVRWSMGFDLLLLIFAAVTLGGLGTAYGALIGSLVVGVFIELSTLVVPPELKSVGALLILVLILLVRPQGVLGQAERVC